jgi:hypothetical protein
LLLAACVPVKTSTITGKLALVSQPAMRWDHRPEADEWTNRALAAVARHDAELAATVPADIEAWCPGYATASVQNRRAFWVGALSAVAKYESSWNPAAVGGGGKYIGVLQISPKSAMHHNCTASSAKALKDGAANLECGVEIMATQVGRDGVVAGKGNRGIGRDWMPFRKAANRAAMSEWTRNQSYCQ